MNKDRYKTQAFFEKDIYMYSALATEIVFIAFSLFILGIRIESVLKDSLYAQTSGGEGPGLYGIYRVWRGDPVYQPLNVSSSAMVFNYLFYYTYGIVAKIFVPRAELLPVFTHLFTLVLIVIFLAVFLYLLWRELKKPRGSGSGFVLPAVIMLFPLTAYLGPFNSWWYLTARPDLIAVQIELIALIYFLYLNARKKSSVGILLVAILCWLAWSWKQSIIFVWLGMLTVVGIQRQWKYLLLLLLSFCVLSALVLWWFGASYVDNTIRIIGVNPWEWKQLIETVENGMVTGNYMYIPAIVFFIIYAVNKKAKAPALTILATVFIVDLIGTVVISAKEAAGRNYYFSSYYVAQLFIVQYLIATWRSKDTKRQAVAAFVITLGCWLGIFLSALYVVFPNKAGKIQLLSATQHKDAQRVCALIRTSSKPVFVQDAYLALPWHTAQYPSDVIECCTYLKAQEYGMILSLDKRIKDKYYAEAFVSEGRWARLLEEAGYRKEASVAGLIRFLRD